MTFTTNAQHILPMKCLLIIDNSVKVEELGRRLKRCGDATRVAVVILSSSAALKRRVYDAILSAGILNATTIDLGYAVLEQVARLREKIGVWAADIGEHKIAGKNVRSWFLLPWLRVSAWWFSFLTERNTVKTDVFLRVAQVNAIGDILARDAYAVCAVGVRDRAFRQSLRLLALKRGVRYVGLPIKGFSGGKDLLRSIRNKIGTLGDAFLAVRFLIRFLMRAVAVRRTLPPRHREFTEMQRKINVVSCFPLLDKKAAGEGVFLNKYMIPLQEYLRDKRCEITWLMLMQPIDGMSYRQCVDLAKAFISRGERMFVVEEYFGTLDFVRVLCGWLRVMAVAVFLYCALHRELMLGEPFNGPCRPLIKRIWMQSFFGPPAVEGMVYAMAFGRFLKENDAADTCLYFAEMHAWERALCAAKKNIAKEMLLIGYQHAIAPRNLLSYFSDKRETERKGEDFELPLPDVFACCGDRLKEMFEPCGYPGLRTVEAIRYLYIDDITADARREKDRRPLLLFAGSIDHNETTSALAMAYEAMKDVKDVEIICKGHPLLRLEGIFEDLGIDSRRSHFTIGYEDIQTYLRRAKAAVVPSSAVAMEALASGCEVIVPLLADSIMMNPVADFPDGYCHLVSTPEQLREIVEKVLGGYRLAGSDEYRRFVSSYWCIDKELPRWKALLS